MGEVFVLQPVLNKNLSLDFENSFSFSGISLGRRSVELAKNGFYFWEGGFGGGKVVFGPPWSGKWYWEGGPSSPYGDTCPLVNHLLGPPFG
jgi:hypothetical protein